jgi:lipopolysaccharide export system protein LptC
MIATKQAAWLFAALLCIACSSWYFASSPIVVKLDKHTLSTTADMIINNLTVHQFDTEGRLVNDLKTPLMRHISANNTHWLKNPRIIVSQQNQPAWTIHAQQATALHGGQQIIFNENVIIHQEKDEHTQESTFKTESITYFPKDKLATTLLDITYERPGNIVQSTGMKAYLAEKRVQLLSQAKGTYEARDG